MTANFFEFHAKLNRPRTAARATAARATAARATADTAGGNEPAAMSVSELTAQITKVINGGLPSSLHVRGEVSNCNRNKSSGHLYFTLKDPDACVDCVMFCSEATRLKFDPSDGIEVLAGGRIGVYPQRGRYQLYVNTLRPLGQGALELAFQQVRRKLESEGLFAPERKKPLPPYPARVVIVTSREAAALHDVLKVLRRFPWLRLMLYPVPVQGEGAAGRIADAMAHVNATLGRRDGADVILLCRGGGSLEDLWCFNEEAVARAVAASRIPVVTGIGHEVDVAIADLAADYHAHTPTEAAQVITAQWKTADERLEAAGQRLGRELRTIAADARQRLRSIERHETFRRPTDRVNQLRQLLDDRQRSLMITQDRLLRERRDRLQNAASRLSRLLPATFGRMRELLAARRQQLDQSFAVRVRGAAEHLARAATMLQECHPRMQVRLATQKLGSIEQRLATGARQRVRSEGQQVEALARELDAVSPQSVLSRGYTMTTRKKDGLPLRSASQVRPGDKLVTRFADGQVESIAEDSKQLSLFE